MTDRATSEQRKIVIERAMGCCEYCRSQARFATQSFSVEHIVPKHRGGETVTENLALACQGCNNAKFTKVDARDPISGATAELYHPRKQKWREHFAWNDDFTLIVGLTPIGRATVDALHLNRNELVNLRRILYSVSEHPPFESE